MSLVNEHVGPTEAAWLPGVEVCQGCKYHQGPAPGASNHKCNWPGYTRPRRMRDSIVTPGWCPAQKARAEDKDPAKVAKSYEIYNEAQAAKAERENEEKG